MCAHYFASTECMATDGTIYTIPYESNSTFNNDVYMTISDDCLRFEACVDFTYKVILQLIISFLYP